MTNSNSLIEPTNTSTLNRNEIYEVCLVVNGPLDMGEGKKVCQSFQLGVRWLNYIMNRANYTEQEWWGSKEVARWLAQGTRSIAKEATTPAIFQRIQDECPGGFMMVDEGFTEVEPDSPTIYVVGPFLHKNRPKVLDNKKVKLL